MAMGSTCNLNVLLWHSNISRQCNAELLNSSCTLFHTMPGHCSAHICCTTTACTFHAGLNIKVMAENYRTARTLHAALVPLDFKKGTEPVFLRDRIAAAAAGAAAVPVSATSPSWDGQGHHQAQISVTYTMSHA